MQQLKLFENVFDKSGLLCEFFEKETKTYTNQMNKVTHPWDKDIVQEHVRPVLDTFMHTDGECLGDNFYKHEKSYFPHVDISNGVYPCVNVLIPLMTSEPCDQKFIVTDQYVTDYNGSTWVGKYYDQMPEFDNNKKRRYLGNEVHNKSLVISDDDFNEYCPTDDIKLYNPLDLNVFDFKPGNILLFDSAFLHFSAKMQCKWKIGLSLRFAGSLQELLK